MRFTKASGDVEPDNATAKTQRNAVRRAAVAVISAGLLAAIPAATATASTAESSTATADDVSCYTGIHNNDPLTGFVGCTNNSGGPVVFRVELVCGWAPDISGDWVRLEPGQSGQSIARCAFYSSGIGEIHAVWYPV
jgi:hypothetical protein